MNRAGESSDKESKEDVDSSSRGGHFDSEQQDNALGEWLNTNREKVITKLIHETHCSKHDAEDVYSEVSSKLIEKVKKRDESEQAKIIEMLREPQRFVRYVCKAVKRKLLDLKRSEKSRKHRELESAGVVPIGEQKKRARTKTRKPSIFAGELHVVPEEKKDELVQALGKGNEKTVITCEEIAENKKPSNLLQYNTIFIWSWYAGCKEPELPPGKESGYSRFIRLLTDLYTVPPLRAITVLLPHSRFEFKPVKEPLKEGDWQSNWVYIANATTCALLRWLCPGLDFYQCPQSLQVSLIRVKTVDCTESPKYQKELFATDAEKDTAKGKKPGLHGIAKYFERHSPKSDEPAFWELAVPHSMKAGLTPLAWHDRIEGQDVPVALRLQIGQVVLTILPFNRAEIEKNDTNFIRSITRAAVLVEKKNVTS